MLSILVATYNGSGTIGVFLAKLKEIKPPDCPWEIIVVDNGSTDNTWNVVKKFEDKIPLKLLSYRKRGKNRALNFGLDHVRGELVLLTDDDIIPEPDWLIKVWNCVCKNKEVDLFGGRIIPLWEKMPPSWITQAIPMGVAFGITPDTLHKGPVAPGAIWGANMFVRRRVFLEGVRFNESVGPGMGNYVMGGDTDFMVRAASKGYKTWFCPDVKVQHRIHPGQLKKTWLLKRAYRHGKSIYETNKDKPNTQGMTLGGIIFDFPSWMLRQWFTTAIKIIRVRLSGDQVLTWKLLWELSHSSGYMVQAARKISRNHA